MPYVESFDREQELALIDKLYEHRGRLTKGRRALAVARNAMKKLLDQEKAIRLELFVLRFGEEGLSKRRASVARNRATLADMRAAQSEIAPSGENRSLLKAITEGVIAAQPQFESIPAVVHALPPSGVNPDRIIAHEPRCPACKVVITKRGLCGCQGVRHRDVRTVRPGPTVNIKHPPVPAFQMAAKEGGGE